MKIIDVKFKTIYLAKGKYAKDGSFFCPVKTNDRPMLTIGKFLPDGETVELIDRGFKTLRDCVEAITHFCKNMSKKTYGSIRFNNDIEIGENTFKLKPGIPFVCSTWNEDDGVHKKITAINIACTEREPVDKVGTVNVTDGVTGFISDVKTADMTMVKIWKAIPRILPSAFAVACENGEYDIYGLKNEKGEYIALEIKL